VHVIRPHNHIAQAGEGNMKILNLFAGIGGNRTLWGDEHEITAVEHDTRIAYIYHKRFPDDEVIVGDAYKYLENYYNKFHIIWASPPCQTHSRLSQLRGFRFKKGIDKKPSSKIPDLRLYSIIFFLQGHYFGEWIVENVKPFYKPLIEPTAEIGRHYIWASKIIPPLKKRGLTVACKKEHLNRGDNYRPAYNIKGVGIDLSKYFDKNEERTILNNCVLPKEGKWILDHLIGTKRQEVLF